VKLNGNGYKLAGHTQIKCSTNDSHDFFITMTAILHESHLTSAARSWLEENTNCPNSQNAPGLAQSTQG
jgi:hypothetical protein